MPPSMEWERNPAHRFHLRALWPKKKKKRLRNFPAYSPTNLRNQSFWLHLPVTISMERWAATDWLLGAVCLLHFSKYFKSTLEFWSQALGQGISKGVLKKKGNGPMNNPFLSPGENRKREAKGRLCRAEVNTWILWLRWGVYEENYMSQLAALPFYLPLCYMWKRREEESLFLCLMMLRHSSA